MAKLAVPGKLGGSAGGSKEPTTRIIVCVIELGDGPLIQRYSSRRLWGERVLLKHLATWAATTEAVMIANVQPRVFFDQGRPGDYAAAIGKQRPVRAYTNDVEEEFYLTDPNPRLDWDCNIEYTGSDLWCGVAAEGGYASQVFIYASFTVIEWER